MPSSPETRSLLSVAVTVKLPARRMPTMAIPNRAAGACRVEMFGNQRLVADAAPYAVYCPVPAPHPPEVTCDVQAAPSHQRSCPAYHGSGYQFGGAVGWGAG